MKLFLAAFILMGSMNAMALSNIADGTYSGHSLSGDQCYVQIKNNIISVGVQKKGKPWDAISMIRNEATEKVENSIFKFSNRADGFKLTLAAALNPQNEIESATIKIGRIFMIKTDCLEMTKKD